MKVTEYQKIKEKKKELEKLIEKKKREKEEKKKNIEENEPKLSFFAKVALKVVLIGTILGIPLCYLVIGKCSLFSIVGVLSSGIISSGVIYWLEFLKNKPKRKRIQELQKEYAEIETDIKIEQDLLDRITSELRNLSETEKRHLEKELKKLKKLKNEQEQIQQFFKLGEKAKKDQDTKYKSKEAMMLELLEIKNYLFAQQKQNILNKRLLELAYRLGTEVLPTTEYTKEELAKCENILGLKKKESQQSQ